MSNYTKIKNFDIGNGRGVRLSVFFSGCDFHCHNCFNQDLWDFENGEQFTREIYDKKIKPNITKHIAGLSILGGEPMHPNNIEAVSDLVDWFIQDFPDKNIWIWSGYTWEELMKRCRDINESNDLNWIITNVDILVDGCFIEQEKDMTLKWRGSFNQRVINVKETLKQNKIVLLED